MPDLDSLSPQALQATMEGGTASWGQWGSADHHRLYVEPIGPEWPMRRRRRCTCGCHRKVTHRVAANGVTLSAGCEMDARRSAKELSRFRRLTPTPAPPPG